MNKKTRNIIIAVAVLLVLVIGALVIYNANKPAAQEGGKKLTVTVVHGDGSTKDFAIATDEYGLYVLTVDGETADEGAQQWWCFTKGGEMLMTGVDDTMIADGESYEITLTTGW